MDKMINDFVIIDDDSCHNIVCALSLKKAFNPINFNIVGFTNVAEGITYLEKKISTKDSMTVLFLDINMPDMSGWDVLNRISKLSDAMKNNLIVYMLSASVSMVDKAKAFMFPFVKDCLEKPLSDHLIYISEELNEKALIKKIYA